jgi:hypothetical protein
LPDDTSPPPDVLAVDQSVITSTGSADFGITRTGFVPKPYARLLAEKLATAQLVLDDQLDLTGGSVIRKLLEVCALEDARTWAAMAAWYDDCFVVSATGTALDRLGEELGLPRPWEEAAGVVTFTLTGALPPDVTAVVLPRGGRLLTPGGHHAALEETVRLSAGTPQRVAAVRAFFPGPEHNLDPTALDADGVATQKLDRWHPDDPSLGALVALERDTEARVLIDHATALTGGELHWPDARYRDLLLRAPRSIWRADAIEEAVSLLPGVRQVVVRDSAGGLDLSEAPFAGFRFLERLFTAERDVASPYFFTVLVAPTPAAIWDGPDGVRAAIEAEIEDLRPISVYPRIERGEEIGIGISATLTVSGVPLPAGSADVVNSSALARSLTTRLLDRVRGYLESLRFGEPVRWAEILHALMDEPGVTDVTDLRLLRYPPGLDAVDLAEVAVPAQPQVHPVATNVPVGPHQVPVLVGDDSRLRVSAR